MMITLDVYCKKCNLEHIDIRVDNEDPRFECPSCGNLCERLWNKMSFQDFKGSHNHEYKENK